jgi:hypothetical protein
MIMILCRFPHRLDLMGFRAADLLDRSDSLSREDLDVVNYGSHEVKVLYLNTVGSIRSLKFVFMSRNRRFLSNTFQLSQYDCSIFPCFGHQAAMPVFNEFMV